MSNKITINNVFSEMIKKSYFLFRTMRKTNSRICSQNAFLSVNFVEVVLVITHSNAIRL